MHRVPVFLQIVGLVGLSVAAYLLWGLGWAILLASVATVACGTVLEVEQRGKSVAQQVDELVRRREAA